MVEILTVYVNISAFMEVKGKLGEAAMLLFGGWAESEYFNGTVCPGGVDTQMQAAGQVRTLSARYILEGEDYTGRKCRIFIENNGEIGDGELKTTPKIYTDSEALSFLEKAKLSGTLTPRESGVIVHIFCPKTDLQIEN